jgi:hypothetical protein
MEVMPYISAAASAYGGAVLAKVQDDAAGATVGFGRRILQRIFGRKKDGEALPDALADVVANPGDDDYVAGLRLAVRKALAGDSQMLAEVREIVKEAKATVSVGPQSAHADHGSNATSATAGRDVNTTNTSTSNTYHGPVISAGRDSHYSENDMTVHRQRD